MKYKVTRLISITIIATIIWQDVALSSRCHICSLRPLPTAERENASKRKNKNEKMWSAEDWEAIAKIFDIHVNNRKDVLRAVVARSLFLDDEEHIFEFRDAENILRDEELQKLSEQLELGNKAAYEVLYWGYWTYVRAWSESPAVTRVREKEGKGHLNSEDLFKEGLNSLKRVASSFNYRKGRFYTYLKWALIRAKKSTERTTKSRRTREQEAGYAYNTRMHEKELLKGEITLEGNIEKGKKVLQAVFGAIRDKVYREAYLYALMVKKLNHTNAVKYANYVVRVNGCSYAHEYIICEYLFGGQIPKHPKLHNQIGEEGVVVINQIGEDGALDYTNAARAKMTKATVSLRYNKAKDLFTSWLVAHGIEVPQRALSRSDLINIIIRESDDIFAYVLRDENSAKAQIIKRETAETMLSSI